MKLSKAMPKRRFFTSPVQTVTNVVSTGQGNFVSPKPMSAPMATVKKPTGVGFGIGSGVAKKGPF